MKPNCNKKIISQTKHGKVVKCYTCHQFHIEFNNLHFTFNKDEFAHFRNYFLELDIEYWETMNVDSIYNRKIMVPVGHKNITTMFQASEVIELRSLLTNTRNKPKYAPTLSFKSIDTSLLWN